MVIRGEVMPLRYSGNIPGNVRKDAKYSVVHGSRDMEIRLIFRLTTGETALVTTAEHPQLVEMVNGVKEEFGTRGGPFYINEYGHVIAPAGEEQYEYYFAGRYDTYLEFEFEGQVLSPKPPPGLRPGDIWPGPKVGIRYTLGADGSDIRYKAWTGPNRYREASLSAEVGRMAAARLARRLSQHKPGGGRLYINEARHFFAPVRSHDDWEHLYLGGLADDAWFEAPRITAGGA